MDLTGCYHIAEFTAVACPLLLCLGTNDLEKGAELAAKLQAGVRGVNSHPGGGPGTPFGGVKQSGIGREGGGTIGLKEFVDVTTLRIAKTGLAK
eukprot:COSAG02_NODE_5454_length_4303_cov_5.503330_4_plen_94_part_00